MPDERQKRELKPSTRLCIVDGCKNEVGRHGANDMCYTHYGKAYREKQQALYTGICACGCGLPTIKNRTFVHGHWAKANSGYLSEIRYKNAKTPHGDGYLSVRIGKRNKLEHIAIAERALGKNLPKGACVHHVNGNRSDNTKGNLVICQDSAYHQLLHKRARALEACGHADYLKCVYCKRWDNPENMYVSPSGSSPEHRSCGNEYRKAYYKNRRAEANA